jgi:hypothetical protein
VSALERPSETSDSSNAHLKDAGHHAAPRGQKAETEMKTVLYPIAAAILAAGSAQTVPAVGAGAPASSPPPAKVSSAAEDTAFRPFHIDVPQSALDDLRRRIAATRWPDKETVADQSQGAQLAKLQELVRYWGNGYDWRKAEAKLNSLPQFMTNIDGVDIHFIHVRSRHPNTLPLLITHGWPGSVIEQLKIIGPLTDPTAHGGRAEDAFDVVIPSLPGYGFSSRPTQTGWGADKHRNLGSAAVLGERRTKPYQCGRAEDQRDHGPGSRHGISGGGLSTAGDVGPARLSQTDLLPRSRQGWTLRGVGVPGGVRGGAARSIQIIVVA